jgi:hypothetical protein
MPIAFRTNSARAIVQSSAWSPPGHRAVTAGNGRPIASSTITSATDAAEPAAEHEIDIHTIAGRPADLRELTG